MRPFQCRSCHGSESLPLIDLGNQPLANNLLRESDLGKLEPRFPLRVAVCTGCHLIQITDLVPPVELFSDYVYFSSFSDTMVLHAKEASERYIREFHLGPENLVVEIASNDGYLLKNFVSTGIPCLGIEPAANVAEVSRSQGIETLVEFFGESLASDLARAGRQADLILGNNVFAHAPDTNDFVAGLGLLLKPGGRVVLEFPYGGDFIEHCEFDTIYHEHVFYFFLTPLISLFARHGLEIFHVERHALHGGSLRLFSGHSGDHVPDGSVAELLEKERVAGVAGSELYLQFSKTAEKIRRDLLALLAKLKTEGKRIAAYGASAKGSTLLSFINPPEGTLDFVVDRSTYKQGCLSPGLHLPIIKTEELLASQPDYTLLLTWNFADEILKQQAEYRNRGGKFIIPIPEVKIV